MAKGDISTEFRRILNDKGWTGVIDLNKMAEEIYVNADLSHLSMQDLRMFYIKAQATSMLNVAGYSSLVYGKAVFVNPDAVDEERVKKESAIRGANKAEKVAQAKDKLAQRKKKFARDVCNGQLVFNFEEQQIDETMSDDEFLEALLSLVS